MRCKACDAVLQPAEIIWRDDIQQHEELCRHCRNVVAGIEEDVELSHVDDMYEDEQGQT